MPVSSGLLLALSLVGGRVTVGTEGMNRVAALASIVHCEDTTARPLGWIVWDETLQPWVAVSLHSPSDLRRLVPPARHLATTKTGTIHYAPLVGALPSHYLIVGGL